jgi:hypothetical protein
MTYFSRAQWGARPPKAALTPWSHDVVGVAVHYEGTQERLDLSDYAPVVRGIQAYHMDVAKDHYIDIAYNFLVAPNGDVFEGRSWDHQSGANGSTVGNQSYLAICYIAGPGEALTDPAKRSFDALFAEAIREHQNATDIQPHRHFFNTACPGDVVLLWLDKGHPLPAGDTPVTTTYATNQGDIDVLPTDVTSHLKTAHGEWMQTADGGIATKAGDFHGSYPGLDAKFHDNVNRRFYATLEARDDGAPGYVLTSNDGGRYAFPTT